jgi:opacity protein-like surface antigen
MSWSVVGGRFAAGAAAAAAAAVAAAAAAAAASSWSNRYYGFTEYSSTSRDSINRVLTDQHLPRFLRLLPFPVPSGVLGKAAQRCNRGTLEEGLLRTLQTQTDYRNVLGEGRLRPQREVKP